jgi:hypothetical protein
MTLQAILDEGKKYTAEEALPLLVQLCDQLESAHRRGVVHHDLSPSKIALSSGGAVTLLDGAASPDAPAYAAPELSRGEAVDHRADLYSLGAIAHRMIAGDAPITGSLAASAGLPESARRFATVVDRLLVNDPAQRCSSAGFVAHAFRVSIRGLDLAAGGEGETVFVAEQPRPPIEVDESAARLTLFLWLERGRSFLAPYLPKPAVRKLAAVALSIVLLAVIASLTFSSQPEPIAAPLSIESLAAEGRALADGPNPGLAIEKLEQLLVADGKYGEPLLHAALARAYVRAGQKPRSLQHYAIAIRRTPAALEDADVRDLAGLLALDKLAAEQAAELLRTLGPRARPELEAIDADKRADRAAKKRAKALLKELRAS